MARLGRLPIPTGVRARRRPRARRGAAGSGEIRCTALWYDGGAEVSREIVTPGDINRNRVLCEEAATAAPDATAFYTTHDLCNDQPFSTAVPPTNSPDQQLRAPANARVPAPSRSPVTNSPAPTNSYARRPTPGSSPGSWCRRGSAYHRYANKLEDHGSSNDGAILHLAEDGAPLGSLAPPDRLTRAGWAAPLARSEPCAASPRR